MILGLMSSGLLPRVCASGVPGQSKTHGQSGFENDLGDLPAAIVANDVPAAFCAPEVFVDAAMIAYDYLGLMVGAALSVYVDAAALCSQIMMNGWIFERFLELLEVFPESLAHSGLFIGVSSCGLMALLLGAHLVSEMCRCGAVCRKVVPVVGTVLRGCECVGVCWVAATFRAAFAVLFNMKILHAAAAPATATLFLGLNNFVVTSEAATEYFYNKWRQHAAAASAAALRGALNFASILGDVFESASPVFWIWFSGMLVVCAGFRYLFGGKASLTSLGKVKTRFVQKEFHETSRPSDLQASTQEDWQCLASDDGDLHLYRDHVNFKGKDRRDTDGSLSLGLGEASGRVDVPVSVNKLIDAAFRSPQSVVVNQSLRVEKNIFCTRGGWAYHYSHGI